MQISNLQQIIYNRDTKLIKISKKMVEFLEIIKNHNNICIITVILLW